MFKAEQHLPSHVGVLVEYSLRHVRESLKKRSSSRIANGVNTNAIFRLHAHNNIVARANFDRPESQDPGVLALLLMGAVEFGRFAYLAIELTNAAKAAAQYGAQNSVTAADTGGMQAVAAQDAPQVTAQCTNFTTTIGPKSCACVKSGSSRNADCKSSCAGGYIVQNLTISTSAQCTPLFYPKGFGSTLTLSGHAVQEVLK